MGIVPQAIHQPINKPTQMTISIAGIAFEMLATIPCSSSCQLYPNRSAIRPDTKAAAMSSILALSLNTPYPIPRKNAIIIRGSNDSKKVDFRFDFVTDIRTCFLCAMYKPIPGHAYKKMY